MRRASGALAAAALALGGLAVGEAAAEGLRVEPGQWEIRTTAKHSMLPAPQVRTRTECIRESEVRPDFFEDPSGQCRIQDTEVAGSRMRWTLVCASEAGEMRGEGELVAEGETMRGSMTMALEAEGQRMTFENVWEGRRLGPCE